jgi:hypothetical protein
VLRQESVIEVTSQINSILEKIDDKTFVEMPIEEIQTLIKLTKPDPEESEHVWNSVAIADSVGQFAKLRDQTIGYVYVDRDRDLGARRRETAGILAGGEYTAVPGDKIALYILRTAESEKGHASWWPQVRFPDGAYAFAFAI